MTMLPRWLLLVALLMSPLAMQPASATSGHAPMASAMTGHCAPDAPAKPHPVADCSMGCASALPAIDLATPWQPDRVPHATTFPGVVRLVGLGPQSATPPPRPA